MAALKPAGARGTGGRPVACVGTHPLSDVLSRGVCSWVGAYGWSAGCSLRGRGRQPSLTSREPWQPPLPLPRGLCPSPLSLCWARGESEGGLKGRQTRGGAWGRHRGGRERKGEREREREREATVRASSASSSLRRFSALPTTPLPGPSGKDMGGRRGLLSVSSWRAPELH